MNEPKPGYKTSELWATAINAVVNLLVAFSVVNNAQADAIVQAAVAVVALIAAVAPIVMYVWSRAKVKAES